MPRGKKSILIKAKKLRDLSLPGERFLNLSLRLRETTPWAQVGHEVGWAQFALPAKSRPKAKLLKASTREFVADDGSIRLPMMKVPPKLTLWRAPTDNDEIGHIATQWQKWGLRDLTVEDCVIREGRFSTSIANTLLTASGIKLKHSQLLERVEGGVRITETLILPAKLHDVARIGTRFELEPDLNQITWLGAGRHESASDRKIGRVHRWRATVDELHTDYIKPQESGARADVRWVAITDASSRGALIELDRPRFVTISPYRSETLADTSHNIDLVKSGTSVVTIDAISRGVGTASCGPDTLPKYKIKPGKYTWSWTYIF